LKPTVIGSMRTSHEPASDSEVLRKMRGVKSMTVYATAVVITTIKMEETAKQKYNFLRLTSLHEDLI